MIEFYIWGVSFVAKYMIWKFPIEVAENVSKFYKKGNYQILSCLNIYSNYDMCIIQKNEISIRYSNMSQLDLRINPPL